jgi:uroporphyrinogen decarboxylase
VRLIDAVGRGAGTPVIPLAGYPGIAATGHAVEDVLTRAVAHLASLLFLEERYHPQCLFHVMDLTVEAEAVGLPIRFEGASPPSVVEHPVRTAGQVSSLRLPEPASRGRMPLFLEVVSELSPRVRGFVGAYCVGPFTLAAELCGAEELAVRTITDPGFATDLVRFTTEVSSVYAQALAAVGAGVVTVLEPTAVILSPAGFEALCVQPLVAVADAVRRGGACPVLHICGDTRHLIGLMAATGMDGLSLDHPVDLEDVLASVPPDMLVLGNVNPVGVMVEGSPEDVRRTARSLVRRLGTHGNFVLSSGCDLPIETPLENLDALFSFDAGE